jgi:hypothetical protein
MDVVTDISAEIKKLTEIASGKGVKVQIITPEKIVVSEWVRFKCRYGCKGYGKHFGCPPYAPSPDETRRMIDEYCIGLLLRFDGVPGRGSFGPDEIPDDFHDWFRDLDKVRPSMEAAGMDVFATAKNVGWDLETIPCKDNEYGKIIHSDIHSIGLVLIE